MVNRPRRSKVVSPMCGGADTKGFPKCAVVRGSFTSADILVHEAGLTIWLGMYEPLQSE